MDGNDPVNAVELRVDAANLISVVKTLMDSDKYALNNPLTHLLNLPFDRLVLSLFKEKEYFSEVLLHNYKLLREKVRGQTYYFYSLAFDVEFIINRTYISSFFSTI